MPDPHHQTEGGQLDDTVAEGEVVEPEAPPARPPKPGKPAPRPPARHWDPGGLGDTIADEGRRGRRNAEDVDLTRIFDRLAEGEDHPLSRYDPEAGTTNVSVKIREATRAVRGAVAGAVGSAGTPFGKLLISLAVALAGIAVGIAAATLHDTWLIVAAILVTPASLLVLWFRYQAWLGHKRYLFRLLETLGEDVSEFEAQRVYRKPRVNAGKTRR